MIKSEKTRQFIIEKCAPVFNKKGYKGTHLSDLTEVTGLSKGSIYGNFKNKNEVAIACFRFNHQIQSQQILLSIEKEESAIQKIYVFLDHYKTQYAALFQNGGCAILNTATEVDDGDEFLKKELVLTLSRWIDKVNSILADAVKDKEITEIDTLNFSHKIVALIEGSILLAKTLNSPSILIQNIENIEKEIKTLELK